MAATVPGKSPRRSDRQQAGFPSTQLPTGGLEFLDLDASCAALVSIRLSSAGSAGRDWLEIDPKSIGGRWQPCIDVSQVRQLAQAERAVVEDCVNAVGVDPNTASAPLLHPVEL